MTLEPDVCGACLEELPRDAWTGIGGRTPGDSVLIVCRTCGPIVAAIDRLVDAGKLTEDGAAARFEDLRWRATDARDPRGSAGRAPDVRALRVRDLELSPLPEGACFSI